MKTIKIESLMQFGLSVVDLCNVRRTPIGNAITIIKSRDKKTQLEKRVVYNRVSLDELEVVHHYEYGY